MCSADDSIKSSQSVKDKKGASISARKGASISSAASLDYIGSASAGNSEEHSTHAKVMQTARLDSTTTSSEENDTAEYRLASFYKSDFGKSSDTFDSKYSMPAYVNSALQQQRLKQRSKNASLDDSSTTSSKGNLVPEEPRSAADVSPTVSPGRPSSFGSTERKKAGVESATSHESNAPSETTKNFEEAVVGEDDSVVELYVKKDSPSDEAAKPPPPEVAPNSPVVLSAGATHVNGASANHSAEDLCRLFDITSSTIFEGGL